MAESESILCFCLRQIKFKFICLRRHAALLIMLVQHLHLLATLEVSRELLMVYLVMGSIPGHTRVHEHIDMHSFRSLCIENAMMQQQEWHGMAWFVA